MVQSNLREAKGADIVAGDYRTLVHSQLVCLSHVFRAENEMPLALTPIYTGQKVCLTKKKKNHTLFLPCAQTAPHVSAGPTLQT